MIGQEYLVYRLQQLQEYTIHIKYQNFLGNTKYQFIIFKQQIEYKQLMKVFELFTGKKSQEIQAIDFVPSIQVNPNSTLFVQCTPNDPHTGSNIVINTYQSKTNRTNLQTRIQWRRFKYLSEIQHTNTFLPFITGNAYRCQPADLGYYIQAKIISHDVACAGSAEVTIGPIKLDPAIKPLIEGALYSHSLRSQINVLQKNESREIDMMLSDKTIKLIDNKTNKLLQMQFNNLEPKIQINPKDPKKIFLRFEKDDVNKVRKWLDTIFQLDSNFDITSKKSMQSYGSDSSRSRIFKNTGSINKIQVEFLTRPSRDQFIFSLRSFVCRQNLKNTIAMECIDNVTEMRTKADAHKFFQYMSLKNEITRLAELARSLEIDRDNKLRDLIGLQQSIADTTSIYVQLLEKKGRQFNVDFNQSFSEISMRRDQIMGKKQLRQIQTENEQLKLRIRELNQQLQLKEFFMKKPNQSAMLNQTSNPFMKKSPDSFYGPSLAFDIQDDKLQKQAMNFMQLSKSHTNLLKQYGKLKQQKRQEYIQHNNQSNTKDIDMVNLLQKLNEYDQDPASTIQKLKEENKFLRLKIEEMGQNMKKANKSQLNPKLNQSIAYQQKERGINPFQQSFIDNQEPSLQSVNQSYLNDSKISQSAILGILENQLKDIRLKNKQILTQNQRLRQERDTYRKELQKLRKNGINPDYKQNLSSSNIFDSEGLKQQNQGLINQRNGLIRRIESLAKEAAKGDGLYERKCEELTKENNYLRKQNQSLKNKIELMKEEVKNVGQLSQHCKESQRLKKINTQLLEELKSVKMEFQRRANPLYNSRVIQLENQINFLKKASNHQIGFQSASQQFLLQTSKLQKQVERLKTQNNDKEAKLLSQAHLIQRLMSSQEENASSAGKDKSYSQTRNDSESNQKLRKKIKQLQQQIILLRRSADALNRSQDMSRDMLSYNQQQMELFKRQKDMLITQNQRLSKMCEKYCKDARQATKESMKWKQQAFDLMKAQHPSDQL